jgi:anti-anti-sigma factor
MMTGGYVSGEVTVDFQHEVWVVTLVGEHDVATAPQLRATLERLLDAGRDPGRRPTRITVDLSRAAFLDSSVLGVLVSVSTDARLDPTADLAVVVDSPECFTARLLQRCGLEHIIHAYTDRAAAIAAISPRRTHAFFAVESKPSNVGSNA